MNFRSFNNIILSDVSVFIKELHLPAHSFVLAAQCEIFRDTLTRGLKTEAIREFRYNDGSPHAYWRMFEYLYKGIYDTESPAQIADPGKF